MKSKKITKGKPGAVLLEPCDPAALEWEMQQIQLTITRRAYELFEVRSREHGHDWEDWFQAESEMLRPVSIAISETANRFSIRANALGFAANELKVSVEPSRISVLGRIDETPTETAGSNTRLIPDQISRVIPLTAEIDPNSAVVELDSGVLKFELLKVVKAETQAAGAGKS